MLEDVGFSKEQAEKSIEILLEIMENRLATKEDLENKLQILKLDLTVRMGVMLASTVAVLTALQSWLS